MHAILPHLRLGHLLQEDARPALVWIAKHGVLSGRAGVLVAEGCRPEGRHAFEVGAVQDEFDVHPAILAHMRAYSLYGRCLVPAPGVTNNMSPGS